MTAYSKFHRVEKLLIGLVLLAYFFFQSPFIHLDLWNDEIYTLKYFTLVSPLQTVTDYHVPNNHVFFNLINNFYLGLIGEKSVYTLMDHPWVLRIISLFYSAGTIFFTFKLAENVLGRTAAVLSVVFLCTTLPYYNFAVGIRGYGLSTFLVTAVSFCIFRYLETPRQRCLLLIAGMVTAAVYTIPLNLYLIVSMVVFFLSMLTIYFVTKISGEKELQRIRKLRDYSSLIIGLIAGILTALLLYAGIFRQVFFNEYVRPSPDFSASAWLEGIRQVFVYFFSYRYLILPLLLIGMYMHVFRNRIWKNNKELFFFFYLFFLLSLPFVISFVRKEVPPDRTFANLIPFFAMMLAWMINGIFKFISDRKRIVLFEAGIAVYCFLILSFQMESVSNQQLDNIRTSTRSQNIYCNYYLNHFRPLSVVRNFKETSYSNSSFVVIRDAEPYDLPEYLRKFFIPVHDFSLIDSVLMTGKKVFLFSRFPNEIENDAFRQQHDCRVKLISEGISYHNLFELERKDIP